MRGIIIILCVTVFWLDGTIEKFPEYETYLEGNRSRYGTDNFALYNKDSDKMMIPYKNIKWVKNGCD